MSLIGKIETISIHSPAISRVIRGLATLMLPIILSHFTAGEWLEYRGPLRDALQFQEYTESIGNGGSNQDPHQWVYGSVISLENNVSFAFSTEVYTPTPLLGFGGGVFTVTETWENVGRTSGSYEAYAHVFFQWTGYSRGVELADSGYVIVGRFDDHLYVDVLGSYRAISYRNPVTGRWGVDVLNRCSNTLIFRVETTSPSILIGGLQDYGKTDSVNSNVPCLIVVFAKPACPCNINNFDILNDRSIIPITTLIASVRKLRDQRKNSCLLPRSSLCSSEEDALPERRAVRSTRQGPNVLTDFGGPYARILGNTRLGYT